MSSGEQFSNGFGNVRFANREHVNHMLQGILYSTDRKAQVAVLQKDESRRTSTSSTLQNDSRRTSASSTSRKNSAISPDTVSEHSFTKEKRKKTSFFGMSSFGKNSGTVGMRNIM